MSFLSKFFGSKKPAEVKETVSNVVAEKVKPADVQPEPAPAPAPEVNIWDMEEDDNSIIEAALEAPPVKSRRRRNATRLLGFEHSEESVVDLFDQKATDENQAALQFPVGWVLVVEGDGRGHCYGLTKGLNQVGRGEENSIKLDFGDTSISRKNHFAIVYDDEERKFILGHGGKSNIIRLNGKAVISNEDLNDGDTIKVGGTLLQLKTLCGPDFDWSEEKNDEEQENVAIA